MNRTLLIASLVIAFAAANCFAAETRQTVSEDKSPQSLLPVASPGPDSSALSSHDTPVVHDTAARLAAEAIKSKEEKSSPIVDDNSKHAGIAPQKTQFGDAAPARQALQAQVSGKSGLVRPKLYASGPGLGEDKVAPASNLTLAGQVGHAAGTTSAMNDSLSGGLANSRRGECQRCKKKAESPDDRPVAAPAPQVSTTNLQPRNR